MARLHLFATLLAFACGCHTSRERQDHPLQASQRAPVAVDAKPSAREFANRLSGSVPECPENMVSIEGRFCIDRYEASLVEIVGGGERPFSPYSTINGRRVRAVSAPNVFPQGYISAVEAGRACAAAGKRLCAIGEWVQACRGPQNQLYGYGGRREPGRCNDQGRSPVVKLYGFRFDGSTMNNPKLNQMPGTLALTGDHQGCESGYGAYDMIGNLHEWVADPSGSFRGGYYLDVSSVGHGEGCEYRTTAHQAQYHDYSTGFRCCADRPGSVPSSVRDAGSPPTPPLKRRRR